MTHSGRAHLTVAILWSALALSLGATACAGAINDPSEANEIAEFTLNSKTAPADGATQLELTTKISPEVSKASRTVTFATTLGTFGEQHTATADADAGGIAKVRLTAPTTMGNAFVTAKVGTTLVREEVTFERAFAESIELTSDAVAVTAGFESTVTLSVTLRRAKGKPTAGDTAVITTTRGLLARPTRSNDDGVITTVFTPGEAPVGSVTIKAAVRGSGGNVLSDSLVLLILPKS